MFSWSTKGSAVWLILGGIVGFVTAQESRPKGPVREVAKAKSRELLRIDLGRFTGHGTVSPDGTRLVYTESFPIDREEPFKETILYDVPKGKKSGSLNVRGLVDDRAPRYLVFSPNSRLLCMTTYSSPLLVFDGRTGNLLHKIDHIFGQASFSRDGKFVSAICDLGEGKRGVRFWDPRTGKRVRDIGGKVGRVDGYTISSDERFIVTEEETQFPKNENSSANEEDIYLIAARLWDASTGKYLGTIGREEFAPASRRSFSRVMRSVGAMHHGYRVRVSPHGQIMLFPGRLDPLLMNLEHDDDSAWIKRKKGRNELFKFSEPGWLLQSVWLDHNRYLLLTVSDTRKWPRLSPDIPLYHQWILLHELPRLEVESTNEALTSSEFASLWQKLGNTDPQEVATAAARLTASPGQAVTMLAPHLKLPQQPSDRDIRQLLDQLDARRHAERVRAEVQIGRLGEQTIPLLQEKLHNPETSLEARRRLERLLVQARHSILEDAETRRRLWGIEILERIATKEARELLQRLADVQEDIWPTREARQSLDRARKHGKN